MLHHHSLTLCCVSKLMRNMHTSMIGVFQFLNIVNVLHSNDAIMGRRREEKSPWFSSRCRLPESPNKKPNKQTTKSSFNTRYASCPFSSSLKNNIFTLIFMMIMILHGLGYQQPPGGGGDSACERGGDARRLA